MIIACAGYERERGVLFERLVKDMGNGFFEEWNESEMCKLLELDGDLRVKLEPVMNFLESAWKSCRRFMNAETQVNRIHRDHGYAQV